jgi:hypothetical protein
MSLLQNGSSLAVGRTVTYVHPTRASEHIQAVIVQHRVSEAELDNGEVVPLTALTLVASDEQWLPVSGFADRYLISSHGKVVSLSYSRSGQQRLLRVLNPQRYPSVSLHLDNVVTQVGLNRLVAQHFLPPPTEARFTHLIPKDGNHLNLGAENLRWVDQQESKEVAVRERFHRYGVENAQSKLTPELVREIRMLATQGYSNQQLALQFRVSRPTISLIVRGLSWRNV